MVAPLKLLQDRYEEYGKREVQAVGQGDIHEGNGHDAPGRCRFE